MDVEMLTLKSQIRLHDGFHQVLRRDAIVEHRGRRSGYIEPVDHGAEIWLDIPVPMRKRVHWIAKAGAPRHVSHRGGLQD